MNQVLRVEAEQPNIKEAHMSFCDNVQFLIEKIQKVNPYSLQRNHLHKVFKEFVKSDAFTSMDANERGEFMDDHYALLGLLEEMDGVTMALHEIENATGEIGVNAVNYVINNILK